MGAGEEGGGVTREGKGKGAEKGRVQEWKEGQKVMQSPQGIVINGHESGRKENRRSCGEGQPCEWSCEW